eukprot:15483899-Alexandrium_andersonii.AAC.1
MAVPQGTSTWSSSEDDRVLRREAAERKLDSTNLRPLTSLNCTRTVCSREDLLFRHPMHQHAQLRIPRMRQHDQVARMRQH